MVSSRSDEKLTTLPLNGKPSRDFRSVLETIAPSETVLDPIPEDDDPDVTHRGWKRAIDTGLRTGNPVWTFCGKLVYIPTVHRGLPWCPACIEATPAGSRHG